MVFDVIGVFDVANGFVAAILKVAVKSRIFLVFVLTYGRDWLKRVFVVK